MSNEWKLSDDSLNDIMYRDHFRGGTRPICIDIPEQGSDRIHFAAIIVCAGKEVAEQIVRDHNAGLTLEGAK